MSEDYAFRASPLTPTRPAGIQERMSPVIRQLALRALHIAWMAVALGLVAECVLLALNLCIGHEPTLLSVAVSVLSRVAWSVIVCGGLAVCAAIPRAAVPVTGLVGLLLAPTVTLVTRAMQHLLLEALAGVAGEFPVGLVLGLSAIRGVEYGTLGVLVALMERRQSGFLSSLAAGAGVGALFGAAAVGLNAAVVGPPAADLAVGFVNELLFPMGCAVALYGAGRLSRLLGGE